MGPKRFIFGLLVLASIAVIVASCARAADVLQCSGGQTACGPVCVNTNTDTENCGACGTACASGQACVSGACTVDCPGGTTKCGKDGGAATCVNTKTDNQNCGNCGKVCNAGQVCYGGQCSGTCGDAKGGQTVCGDGGVPYCADLKADHTNCGTCGHACASSELCTGGVCTSSCDADQTACPQGDGGSYCANLNTDNGNCGACGTTCSGLLNSCMSGACGSMCTATQIICGGDGGTPYCVDYLSDNKNCGSCGNACSGTKPLCAFGKCNNVGTGGTVYYTSGTTAAVVFVPCGNGTNTNCTESVAQTSCTNLGRKLVSHASDGTTSVVSLGATVSCEWDISYFINNDTSVAGQCLIGMSNAYWTSCCGTTLWHGNIVTVPTTIGQQFGYVYTTDSGYKSGFSNVTGTTWGCQALTSPPPARSGCTTYYVACL